MKNRPHTVWYEEGKNAAKLKIDISKCPYKKWSYGYAEWNRGYTEIIAERQQCQQYNSQ